MRRAIVNLCLWVLKLMGGGPMDVFVDTRFYFMGRPYYVTDITVTYGGMNDKEMFIRARTGRDNEWKV